MPWYIEWLLFYLVIINIISIIVTIYDKSAAKKNKWRVSEKTLFILSAAGAGLSIYLTMLTIRHKTLHKRFMIGIPAIIIIEIMIIILIAYLVMLHG
ncbi:MAG: DUF1294 domain-containing protein [Ruminococcaceae bacterium]|nr:DUF1294 domain-containing protein [Oscillospiraceae bacterium]